MRYVMEKHADSLGFAVDAFESYAQATQSLTEQFQQFGTEYSGVIFGWPIAPQEDATAFAQCLENTERKDLPVVVMSTDMRAETRAWVAGRDHTEILAWREYQGLDALLQELIDAVPEDESASQASNAQKDNRDIHLLVVDDSATIRYSLRDLFQGQGYRVTLAATRDEAMRYATATEFDIAVLDYYLTETTGDVLCRELLASSDTSDVVCTVLTGTYSDHIIKRSLRAGAVECMFKNESSELLLSRINAISRFVRQRRQLQAGQQLLEEVVECIAGAVILISNEQRIVYVNSLAVKELEAAGKSELTGQPASALLEEGGPAASGRQIHAATWQMANGSTLPIDYQHTLIDASGYSLLRFAKRSVPIADGDKVMLQQSNDPLRMAQGVVRQFSLNPGSEPFFLQMQSYLEAVGNQQSGAHNGSAALASRTSFLVLDVFVRQADGELVSVAERAALAERVHESLTGVLARENHVFRLLENRYGFLLRHAEDSQAYVLTRKVMQRCLEVVADESPEASSEQADDTTTQAERALACRASLLSLTRNASQPMSVLVQHTFKGMELMNTREPDQAILLDVRRLLSAYPVA